MCVCVRTLLVLSEAASSRAGLRCILEEGGYVQSITRVSAQHTAQVQYEDHLEIDPEEEKRLQDEYAAQMARLDESRKKWDTEHPGEAFNEDDFWFGQVCVGSSFAVKRRVYLRRASHVRSRVARERMTMEPTHSACTSSATPRLL